jgi:selenocysteine lyase/cysteine desulfurase
LEYLEWVGRTFGGPGAAAGQSRKDLLRIAMETVRENEYRLSQALIESLEGIPGLRIYGLTDLHCLDRRVPTVSFTLDGRSPREVAERLAQAGINVWDGNFYALAVTERLGLEPRGGLVRVGATHYNTVDEIQQVGTVLKDWVK